MEIVDANVLLQLVTFGSDDDRFAEIRGVVTALKPVRAERVIEAARVKAELDCATLWVCFAYMPKS